MADNLDIINESDRGAVIVGAAMLEAELDELLAARLDRYRVSKKMRERLFDLSGPLSSFGAKSLICRSFGMISDAIFHDLEIIRKMRNDFAHSTHEVDFLSKEVADVVRNLHCIKGPAADFERKRYSLEESVSMPQWELRAKGYLKYTKAVFCLGVRYLALDIKMANIDYLREQVRSNTSLERTREE